MMCHFRTIKASDVCLKPLLLVGIPGLEPGITGPESVGSAFPETDKGFLIFFSLKEHFSLFGGKKPREIRTFVGRKLKKWIN